jgi:hypothetical protein
MDSHCHSKPVTTYITVKKRSGERWVEINRASRLLALNPSVLLPFLNARPAHADHSVDIWHLAIMGSGKHK